MSTTAEAETGTRIARLLGGYAIQYVACSFLTPVLLSCFAALLFIQIAVLGPEIRWLQHLPAPLLEMVRRGLDLPGAADQSAQPVDIESVLSRLYWGFTLLLMLLAMLVRLTVRGLRALRGMPASQEPEHRSLGLGVALAMVTVIFVVALLAVPHARVAAGSGYGFLYTAFGAAYFVAAVCTVIYLVLNGLAGRVMGR